MGGIGIQRVRDVIDGGLRGAVQHAGGGGGGEARDVHGGRGGVRGVGGGHGPEHGRLQAVFTETEERAEKAAE